MRFLPVFLDLQAGTVVLAGSGEAAANKLRLLRAAGARVRWYMRDNALAHARDAGVEIITGRAADDCDLSDAIAVVSAAGEPEDSRIAARARARNIPVNVVDRPDLSTFIVPAIVDRCDVVVAIGTGGTAPVLARRLRERIEALLPARIGELAALMGRYRARLSRAIDGSTRRRRFWERVADGPIGAALLAGRGIEAEAALVRAINSASRHGREPGTIVFVSAPGEPDLLTLRALHALQNADIVFHDADVPAAVLDRARRDAERVVADPSEIKRRLLEAARASRRAVRLSSGTPSIDEHEFVRMAGVSVDIVPAATVTVVPPIADREAA